MSPPPMAPLPIIATRSRNPPPRRNPKNELFSERLPGVKRKMMPTMRPKIFSLSGIMRWSISMKAAEISMQERVAYLMKSIEIP